MNEEEKKAIDELSKKAVICKYESRDYPNMICFKKDMIIVLNLIEKLQKENEKLKEKENKIYKEVHESLAFEKFLIVKERKPDLFNQGRFYISQIIYDILNDVQNPEGIHKENKCIQYIDYIPVQIVKDNIEKEIKYHERNILDIENTTMLNGKTAKEEAEIEFNKYEIVVLKKILQELIEEREEK